MTKSSKWMREEAIMWLTSYYYYYYVYTAFNIVTTIQIRVKILYFILCCVLFSLWKSPEHQIWLLLSEFAQPKEWNTAWFLQANSIKVKEMFISRSKAQYMYTQTLDLTGDNWIHLTDTRVNGGFTLIHHIWLYSLVGSNWTSNLNEIRSPVASY